MSPAIDVHVRPRSVLFTRYGEKSPYLWLSNATYTVLGSWWLAFTSFTNAMSGTFAIAPASIRRQFSPPSSVTQNRPSSVPA